MEILIKIMNDHSEDDTELKAAFHGCNNVYIMNPSRFGCSWQFHSQNLYLCRNMFYLKYRLPYFMKHRLMNKYPFFMSDSFNRIVEPYSEGVEYEEYVRVKLNRGRTQWIKSWKG